MHPNGTRGLITEAIWPAELIRDGNGANCISSDLAGRSGLSQVSVIGLHSLPCQKFPCPCEQNPCPRRKNSLPRNGRELATSHWACGANSCRNRRLCVDSENIPCQIRCQREFEEPDSAARSRRPALRAKPRNSAIPTLRKRWPRCCAFMGDRVNRRTPMPSSMRWRREPMGF